MCCMRLAVQELFRTRASFDIYFDTVKVLIDKDFGERALQQDLRTLLALRAAFAVVEDTSHQSDCLRAVQPHA